MLAAFLSTVREAFDTDDGDDADDAVAAAERPGGGGSSAVAPDGAPVVLDASALLAATDHARDDTAATARVADERGDFPGLDSSDSADGTEDGTRDIVAPVFNPRTYSDGELQWTTDDDDDDASADVRRRGDADFARAARYIDDAAVRAQYAFDLEQIDRQKVCVFVCAPRGSGKTMLIKALEAYMRTHDMSVSTVPKPNLSAIELDTRQLPALHGAGGGGSDGGAAGLIDLCAENGCATTAAPHRPRVAANLGMLAADDAATYALRHEVRRLCSTVLGVYEHRAATPTTFTLVETCPEEQDHVWLPMLRGVLSALDVEVLAGVQSALRLCAGAARIYEGHHMFVYIDARGDAKMLRRRLQERARVHATTIAQRSRVAQHGGTDAGEHVPDADGNDEAAATAAATSTAKTPPGTPAAAAVTIVQHQRVIEPETVEMHEHVPSLHELEEQIRLYDTMFKGTGLDNGKVPWCANRPVLHFEHHHMDAVAKDGAASPQLAALIDAIVAQVARGRRSMIDDLNRRYGVPPRGTGTARHRHRHLTTYRSRATAGRSRPGDTSDGDARRHARGKQRAVDIENGPDGSDASGSSSAPDSPPATRHGAPGMPAHDLSSGSSYDADDGGSGGGSESGASSSEDGEIDTAYYPVALAGHAHAPVDSTKTD